MIIELLTQKGFVQGVDYSYENGVLTALQRTRLVDQEIDHEEVPAVLGAEGDVIEPAIPAWTEVIQVEETYTVQIPSLDQLKRELVAANDSALIISQYLKDKPVAEDDSLNIDLFLQGQGGWRFQNIPAPSIDELYDLIVPVKATMEIEAAKQAKLKAGADARRVCQDVLDYIAGSNLEKSLTIQQITELQSVLAAPEAALRAGRPTLAKQLINSIIPDGVLVSAEDKATALELLAGY